MYGVSLLNDGKYSFDSRSNIDQPGHDIGLTVLRSPAFAHHFPMKLEPDGIYNYMDQGRQSFRYVIYPHPGRWEDSGVVQHAAELNQSPFVLLGTYHPEGNLPQINSYLSIDMPNVITSVLKQSEDGEGLILRCYETSGLTVRAMVSSSLLIHPIAVELDPYEIKTLMIPLDPSMPVKEVNLIEFEDGLLFDVDGNRSNDA
jgi:alpha-mannosidase